MFGDYVGLGYFAWLAAAVAGLVDSMLNRARITTMIVNGMLNAVGLRFLRCRVEGSSELYLATVSATANFRKNVIARVASINEVGVCRICLISCSISRSHYLSMVRRQIRVHL